MNKRRSTRFYAAVFARAHGVDGRKLRRKLRAKGLRAPYQPYDIETVLKEWAEEEGR
jgi:hypothetical protein